MLILSALAVGKTFLPALLRTESWQAEPGSASLPGRLEASSEDSSPLPACCMRAELRAVPLQAQAGACRWKTALLLGA